MSTPQSSIAEVYAENLKGLRSSGTGLLEQVEESIMTRERLMAAGKIVGTEESTLIQSRVCHVRVWVGVEETNPNHLEKNYDEVYLLSQ